TQITFTKADLIKADFATDDSGQRIGTGSERLPVTPVLLNLNITGTKMTPPPEATATPLPTDTPELQVVEGESPQITDTPLANATAAPSSTATALAPIPLPPVPESSPVLPLLVALVTATFFALMIVLAAWARSRRR